MRRKKYSYPNNGDGMFFYHKKTRHPAKQLAHSTKTWTNRRYTTSPNNLTNYIKDDSIQLKGKDSYYQKTIFVDSIYTRGRPYSQINKKAPTLVQMVDRRTDVHNSTLKRNLASTRIIKSNKGFKVNKK